MRDIIAQVLDITFEREGGELVGVGSAQYVLNFDKTFQTATFRCQGAIFAPGVDPFDPDSVPIKGSEFTCGDADLVFKRLRHTNAANSNSITHKIDYFETRLFRFV